MIWKPDVTVAAVAREALEETACTFEPSSPQGVYQYHPPGDDVTYLRFAFTGGNAAHDAGRALDVLYHRPA